MYNVHCNKIDLDNPVIFFLNCITSDLKTVPAFYSEFTLVIK